MKCDCACSNRSTFLRPWSSASLRRCTGFLSAFNVTNGSQFASFFIACSGVLSISRRPCWWLYQLSDTTDARLFTYWQQVWLSHIKNETDVRWCGVFHWYTLRMKLAADWFQALTTDCAYGRVCARELKHGPDLFHDQMMYKALNHASVSLGLIMFAYVSSYCWICFLGVVSWL